MSDSKMSKSLWHDKSNVSAAEFSLVAAVVAAAMVGIIGTLTGGFATAFSNIMTVITGG